MNGKPNAATRRINTAGGIMLAALLGMSAGTVLLESGGGAAAQVETGTLVTAGLLTMLGSAVWLLRAAGQGRGRRL